jgi:hypothetical protein
VQAVLLAAFLLPALAAGPSLAVAAAAEALQATASPAARQNAIQSLPMEKLNQAARAKVSAVLSNVTVFRRLPIRMIGCDPDLYLFLVRHPDVLINIWEVLGISQIQIRQIGPDNYRIVEGEGTSASMEILYRAEDTHLVYGQWSYSGTLLPKPIRGRCLAMLKSGFVREADGRSYVSSRLDAFLSVEPGGAELLTKTLHPLVIKNADANFIQTLAFAGSLSRTAEVNTRGMLRLAGRLSHVAPETREQFGEVVSVVADRWASLLAQRPDEATLMAGRVDAPPRR